MKPSDATLSVSGRSQVIVTDADGHHAYGALHAHPREKVRALDVWLDSLDAANELPDGALPGEKR
jgi:hypothetical protein